MATKRQKYEAMLNDLSTPQQLDYLTVTCSSRSRTVANQARLLIAKGKYAEALRKADPIAYEVGLNEFK